jgi:hypothetical protein
MWWSISFDQEVKGSTHVPPSLKHGYMLSFKTLQHGIHDPVPKGPEGRGPLPAGSPNVATAGAAPRKVHHLVEALQVAVLSIESSGFYSFVAAHESI